MIRFIGSEVSHTQDATIIKLDFPIIKSNSNAVIDIIDDDGDFELITSPNSNIQLSNKFGRSFQFTSDNNGRVNLSNIPSSIYQLSINNSPPEPLIMAKRPPDPPFIPIIYYLNPRNYSVLFDGILSYRLVIGIGDDAIFDEPINKYSQYVLHSDIKDNELYPGRYWAYQYDPNDPSEYSYKTEFILGFETLPPEVDVLDYYTSTDYKLTFTGTPKWTAVLGRGDEDVSIVEINEQGYVEFNSDELNIELPPGEYWIYQQTIFYSVAYISDKTKFVLTPK